MSVHVEHHDHVTVVSLARPPANAMTTASLHEVAETFERLGGDDRAAAIVLTGEGRSFSAGLDLREIGDDPGDQEALIEALNRAFLAVYSCPKLVVAAVNGHAIAGGLILALCADIRLA
ncbi:MAG: enoyl-CoA hydratase/isomerase family protein, partial [Ilumatobacteraceae bacterium]